MTDYDRMVPEEDLAIAHVENDRLCSRVEKLEAALWLAADHEGRYHAKTPLCEREQKAALATLHPQPSESEEA